MRRSTVVLLVVMLAMAGVLAFGYWFIVLNVPT
jgi:hypothetical protein